MNVDTGNGVMQVQVKKWGNSASVRIPASIMAAASLKIDQPVNVREEDGRIVIEPIRAPVLDLAAMIARMTPETFHDEVDFGAPVGDEAW
jgi:antitoxin MazE